jgi:hypothetical protein
MVMNAQLNNAWINEICQLPWKSKVFNSCEFAQFFHQSCSTVPLNHLQMKIKARTSIKDEEI